MANLFRSWPVPLAVFFLMSLPLHGRTCTSSDLQSCSSCPALAKVLVFTTPDAGEYYRGAFWNGLFAAYRLNCLALGHKLLEHGANPNLGGASGSFLATLVQSWPHKDEKINRKWAELICNKSVEPDWRNPWTGESAREIISNQEVNVDYPQLWEELSSRCRPSGEAK
jgi:hypothetical protein